MTEPNHLYKRNQKPMTTKEIGDDQPVVLTFEDEISV